MADIAAWLSAAIAVIALIVAYITYLSQRGRAALQYAITTLSPIIPSASVKGLEISFKYQGRELNRPTITIFRVVNAGDRPIRKDDFESDLVFSFAESSSVVSAEVTASRPIDLGIQVHHEANRLHFKPVLINPGDAFEVRVISDGSPKRIETSGRIASISAISRREIPYPPGSGREGEMLKFDRFMWYALAPALLLFPAILILPSSASVPTKVIVGALEAAIIAAYLAYTKVLVNKRRRWKISE